MKTVEKENKLVEMMKRIDGFKAEVFSQRGVTLYTEYGRKYCKLAIGGSVFCFIDLANGDVLKAATWRAPAKHARGNIFAEDFGASAVNEYGANYIIR